jgi:phospholipase A1/A2
MTQQWLAALAALALAGAVCAQDQESTGNCGERFLDKQVGTYDPIYFIVGNDSTRGSNAKFQVSIDFQIFCTGGKVANALKLAPSRQVHLSFSQTSIWDLSELSAPFRDSSYRPRLFYRVDPDDAGHRAALAAFDVGIAHESNGKAGVDSRSIDMLFIRPDFALRFGADKSHELNIQPMIYTYYGREPENRDIAGYRGYVDLYLGYQWGPLAATGERLQDPWKAWLNLRKGTRSSFGSIEANFAFPYRSLPLLRKSRGWLLLQYFNGYGENLLEYNQKLDSQLRLGILVTP